MRGVPDLEHKLGNLSQALDRLEEALRADPAVNDLAVDAAIKRYEFVWNLTWTTLQTAGVRGMRPFPGRPAVRRQAVPMPDGPRGA